MRRELACITLVLGLLAGCAAPSASRVQAAGAFEPCVHPWPCADGSEWPADLAGPFGLRGVTRVEVGSHDGVVLRGWLALPDAPEGTRLPVLLHSGPYTEGFCWTEPFHVASTTETCLPTPDRLEEWWVREPHAVATTRWGAPPIEILERGYAMAFFGVRGVGNSGGCFTWYGEDEQKDQALLVEWAASQPWSSGRVAFGGLSYPATTALHAAVAAPAALKTVVVAGVTHDSYTFFHTPQGAAGLLGAAEWGPMYAADSALVPPLGGGPRHALLDHAPVVAERLCPDVAQVLAGPARGAATGDRNEAFWTPRRFLDDYPRIEASVLLAHGFQDNGVAMHALQDDVVWPAIHAPKRQVVGQWAHDWPRPGVALLDEGWTRPTWNATLLAWLDFWLKGEGPVPEGLGRVDYQDTAGAWRRSAAWPPAEAREEAVHLAGDALSPSPAAKPRAFRAVPASGNEAWGGEVARTPFNAFPAFCADDGPLALLYESEPLVEGVVLAGNPFALLRLSADAPGGVVAVHVFEVPPDFDCMALAEPPKLHLVAFGAADLRFHQGNFVGTDFPVGVPTDVRVDLWDVAESVEAGHRLAVLVSASEAVASGILAQPYYPEVTIHPGSHLVLPFVEGTLGGGAPAPAYPPRPFVGA